MLGGGVGWLVCGFFCFFFNLTLYFCCQNRPFLTKKICIELEGQLLIFGGAVLIVQAVETLQSRTQHCWSCTSCCGLRL